MNENDLALVPSDPLPIIDSHQHLFAKASPGIAAVSGKTSYTLEDYLLDFSGHNLVASVYVEAHSGYRADGPCEMATVGEVEYANGQAALSASGTFGAARVAAAIIGTLDFRMGDVAGEVLDAMIRAGGDRFRGIRQNGAWDADQSIINFAIPNPPGLYLNPDFRAGFRQLAARDLVFDAFVLHPQIDDVASLAAAFPATPIVLNHLGNVLGVKGYAGRRAEIFAVWQESIERLARHTNVFVKLGGLGNFLPGLPSFKAEPRFAPDQLADEWRPYVDVCIEAFGATRCMFESNYPVDSFCGSVSNIVKAFKRITAHRNEAERTAIFADTAARFYSITLTGPSVAELRKR